MAVELVSPEFAYGLAARIGQRRITALDGFERMPPPGSPDEARYWEQVLAANAALVLQALSLTALPPPFSVHYRFFENRGGELRIRPFVSRTDTDAGALKRVLDWHPPPDAEGHGSPDQDAGILYRHFSLSRTPEGIFEYWFAMREIWASSAWVHARVIATASYLDQFISQPGWRSEHRVQQCAPAVVTDEGNSSHLAVLVYSPITCEKVVLEHVEVLPDKSIRYGPRLTVATGPRGYLV